MKHTMRYACLIAAVALFGLTVSGEPPQCDSQSMIDFQISTDKTAYRLRSVMHVKFILTNASQSPVYVYRFLHECSSENGFISFQILDQKGHNLRPWTCSADSWPPLAQVDALKVLSDSSLWIVLKQGESTYGELHIELPAKKGNYRLQAELVPPAFTDKQRDILSQKEMSVLGKPCTAHPVTITVTGRGSSPRTNGLIR